MVTTWAPSTQKSSNMDIKIPFYQILNILLVGIAFACGIVLLFPETVHASIAELKRGIPRSGPLVPVLFLAVSYEAGLVLNRVGSVCLEPLLKSLKLLRFCQNYKTFAMRQGTDQSIQILSREYASSRTRMVLYGILGMLSFFSRYWPLGFCGIALSVLFLYSCRKHSSRIVEVVEQGEQKI